jgi:CRP/FNR family transcriptional regulator, cyclic AMP receptor protein
MLPTDQRVHVLQSVSIFAQLPEPVLAEVVPLLQELHTPAETMIVQKGQLGDCLYIIVTGRVRVHDGELVLNTLGAGDVFGEIALLDPGPRMASVTAELPTQLFRLDAQPFQALLDRQGEMARSVIRTLCQYLRNRVHDMAEDFEYMRQFNQVAAAAQAVQAGVYTPESLDQVAARGDALGDLARIFQHMVREVHAREERLRQQVSDLRIVVDHSRKQREVAEITETDYFQQLQARARALRRK